VEANGRNFIGFQPSRGIENLFRNPYFAAIMEPAAKPEVGFMFGEIERFGNEKGVLGYPFA
jgi:hypothetical protein